MATWRLLGVLKPTAHEQFLENLSEAHFYRLVCSDVPSETDNFLVFSAWVNQQRLGMISKPVVPEQVFNWDGTGAKLLSLKIAKPIRSEGSLLSIDVALYEWTEESPKPDPGLNLWLPGNH